MFSFKQFFIATDSTNVQLLTGSYDPWLVALSLCIAIGASYMALALADVAQQGYAKSMQRLHLLTGALSLGFGVWAMHFVGMLAFQLATPVHYHTGVTLLSAVPSLLASWVTLHMLSSHAVTWPRLLAGGMAVGLGIGTMHYAGMAAMQLEPLLRYDPVLFTVSILVAASLATLALWISFGLRLHLNAPESLLRLIAAIVMGLAIAGMHYTAMQAARFVGTPQPGYNPDHENHFALAIGIALVTIVLSLLVMAVNALARYQALLRRSEASASELKAMFDTAVDGIVKIAANGTILAANASAQRLLGYSERELVGSNVNILMPEPHRARHDGYLERYLTTGQARIIGSGREVIARHKNGREIPVRLAIGESRLQNQHIFVGFLSDISEQKALARELQEREHQYRTLIANLPGAAFRCLWDEHWTPLFISDYVEKLTGWSAADFMQGKVTLAGLIHPDHQSPLDQEMAEALAQRTSYTVKYRMQHRNGNWMWIEEIATPIFNEQTGRVRWIDGILMDITERHTLETQLRESKLQAESAAQAKSAFLANMSHEIRTPMNAIIGFTDLVLETPLNDAQVRNLTIVRSSARNLLSLLNNILDTAKLESGNTELENRNFSLQAICEQILATQSLAAGKKGLRLALAYHPLAHRFFKGDPLRVQQIVLNLVSNAVKFTDRGQVVLQVRPGPGRLGVRIVVKDTGIGIPNDRLQRIFEPFSQADSSMTRRFGGTGLGTTIARQLTELMGGRINVVSRLDKGSIFCVHLPLEAGMAPECTTQEPTEFELPPMRLLVADDVEQNLELIAALLGARHHTIIAAADGLQAVEAFQREPFDAVLLDVQMPVMNGHDACRAMRRHEHSLRRKPTPIIALTASVTDEDRRQARDAGMDGFAIKPIDINEITSELARLTGVPARQVRRKLAKPAEVPALIDADRLKTLWATPQAHATALARFLNDHSNTPEHLKALFDTGRYDQARLAMHRIKGTSGNLCLTQLVGIVADIEKLLAAQQTEAAARHIAHYSAAFQALSNVPASVPTYTERHADSPTAAAGEPDTAALALLVQKLQRGQTPSDLLESARPHLPAAVYEQAYEALDNFEPETAAAVLAAHLKQLPTS